MPLVKVTRSRQITIPKELFEALDLRQGDYLEVVREGDTLILRPKTVVDRERTAARERLSRLLERVWERNKDVDPAIVEREVAQAIQAVRTSRREARTPQTSP